MTPRQLVEDYIQTHVLRKASVRIYRASLNALLKFFPDTPIEDITHRAVLIWRQFILGKNTNRTWNNYSGHLCTVWKYGLEEGLITHTTVNPFKKISVPVAQGASKTVPLEAAMAARDHLHRMEAYERAAGPEGRAEITPPWFWLTVFETYACTGMRLSALRNIRLQDVHWDRREIFIRGETEKTHRAYTVPISDALAPHVLRLLEKAKEVGFADHEQLFNVNRFSHHYHGKEMTLDQVEAMYKKLSVLTGTRMSPHRFRHTLASDLMAQPDCNIHLVKNLLNHSNIKTTIGYIEPNRGQMLTAMNTRDHAQGVLEYARKIDHTGLLKAPEACEPVEPQAMDLDAGLDPMLRALNQRDRAQGILAYERKVDYSGLLQATPRLALPVTTEAPLIEAVMPALEQEFIQRHQVVAESTHRSSAPEIVSRESNQEWVQSHAVVIANLQWPPLPEEFIQEPEEGPLRHPACDFANVQWPPLPEAFDWELDDAQAQRHAMNVVKEQQIPQHTLNTPQAPPPEITPQAYGQELVQHYAVTAEKSKWPPPLAAGPEEKRIDWPIPSAVLGAVKKILEFYSEHLGSIPAATEHIGRAC